jgi:peptidoglycan/xylan/chitin deacetylase (PgdA/CDA1 family)
MYSMQSETRQRIVDDVFVRFGNKRTLLTKEEVIELSRHPLVDIQNHTMTHLSCSHRPVFEVLDEVRLAQATLRQWTGKDCTMVCYPFCHHTAETDAAIRAMGLVPVCGDAGEGTLEHMGRTRNMFKDYASLQENIGRSLNAWRKVTIAS